MTQLRSNATRTSVVAGAVDALDHTGAALAPTAPDGSMPYRAGRAVGGGWTCTNKRLRSVIRVLRAPCLVCWQPGKTVRTMSSSWATARRASANAFRLAGSISVEMTRETTSITYDEYLRKRGHVVSDTGV